MEEQRLVEVVVDGERGEYVSIIFAVFVRILYVEEEQGS